MVWLITFSDPYGGTATMILTMTVTEYNVPPSAPVVVIPPGFLNNGHFHAGFAGTPGYAYTIQYSDNTTGPWTDLETVTAGDDGSLEVDDPAPPPSQRFYRTIYP
jgi:hypothetical protein